MSLWISLRRRPLMVAALVLVAFGLAVATKARALSTPPVYEQPIRFSHKIHLAKPDVECGACHEGVDEGPYATLPPLDTCIGCHHDPVGKNPEEPRVREFVSAGEIPWVRVNRLPGHVYFDHRAHVKWGELDCSQCHGNMREAAEPVRSSQISDLKMARCIGCHTERGVRTDCVTCHK